MKKIISFLLNAIYKLFSVFHLQFTLIVAVIGVVLYFTGILTQNGTVKLLFEIVLLLSIFVAIVETVKSLLNLEPEKKRGKVGISKVESTDNKQVVSDNVVAPPVVATESAVPVQEEKPVYYRVKQNPKYVMAEYSDRYELYENTKDGLKRVRIDRKY